MIQKEDTGGGVLGMLLYDAIEARRESYRLWAAAEKETPKGALQGRKGNKVKFPYGLEGMHFEKGHALYSAGEACMRKNHLAGLGEEYGGALYLWEITESAKLKEAEAWGALIKVIQTIVAWRSS